MRRIETKSDDMNRYTFPFDGNFDAIHEIHTSLFGCCLGNGQTIQIIVIGQGPKVHTIGGGTLCHLFGRQKTIGNGGVAVKIKIGWGHG